MADVQVGSSTSAEVEITDAMVRGFAEVSGDFNPIHLDEEFAKTTRFGRRIAHGMLTGALISRVLAGDVPGPGAVYLAQTLKFKRPVFLGDRITIRAEVTAFDEKRGIIKIATTCTNQNGKVVADGEATALHPEKA